MEGRSGGVTPLWIMVNFPCHQGIRDKTSGCPGFHSYAHCCQSYSESHVYFGIDHFAPRGRDSQLVSQGGDQDILFYGFQPLI